MRLLEGWVTGCFQRPRTTLLALLAVTAVAGWFGTSQFQLNSSMDEVILPRASEQWFGHDEALKAAFPQLRNVALIVASGPDAAAVSTVIDQVLAARPEDIDPGNIDTPMRDPVLLGNLIYYLDAAEFAAFRDALAPMAQLLPVLAQRGALSGILGAFAASPTGPDQGMLANLLKGDASMLLDAEKLTSPIPAVLGKDDNFYEIVLVDVRPDFNAQLPAAEVAATLERWIAPYVASDPDVRLALTGDVILANEEISDALGGVKLAATLSSIFLALVVALGVRSWVLTLGMLLLIAVGSIWTHALAMLTVGQYNTLSLAFLVMFFGLGVDFGLHYGLAVRESAGEQSAVAAAVRKTGVALVLSAGTTAIAFLSFTPTEYRGLGELGVISAGGMAVALFLTLTLLPALFGWFGVPGYRTTRSVSVRLPSLGMGATLLIWLLLGLFAAIEARKAQFDYSVAGLRNLDTPAMNLLQDLQTAGFSTEYSISSLVAEADVDNLSAQLEALDAVGYVASIRDYLPAEDALGRVAELEKLAQALALIDAMPPLQPDLLRGQLAVLQQSGADSEAAVVELAGLEDAELTARDEALREILLKWSGELAPIVNAQPVSLDDLSPALRDRWIAPDGRQRIELGPALPTNNRAGLDYFVDEVNTVIDNGGGRAVIERGVGSVVVRAFGEASLLALAAITVLLAVYYRGVVMPIVVVLPLLLTTLLTFAVMGWVHLSLNMANVLVVPLIFGLGIDSAIHVAHRYQTLGSMSGLMASSTPRAVLLSAITTVATFASLMTSAHRGAASLGQLLSIAIPIMVVVTFSLIPILLQGVERIKSGFQGHRS